MSASSCPLEVPPTTIPKMFTFWTFIPCLYYRKFVNRISPNKIEST